MPLSQGNPGLQEAGDRLLLDMQRQFEREWRDALDKSLAQITRDADKRVEQVIASILEAMVGQLVAESGQGGGSFASGGAEAQLGQAVGKLVAGTLSDLLGGGSKTRVSSQETARSQAAVNEMRLSKSQQRAESERNTTSGQRNL